MPECLPANSLFFLSIGLTTRRFPNHPSFAGLQLADARSSSLIACGLRENSCSFFTTQYKHLSFLTQCLPAFFASTLHELPTQPLCVCASLSMLSETFLDHKIIIFKSKHASLNFMFLLSGDLIVSQLGHFSPKSPSCCLQNIPILHSFQLTSLVLDVYLSRQLSSMPPRCLLSKTGFTSMSFTSRNQ